MPYSSRLASYVSGRTLGLGNRSKLSATDLKVPATSWQSSRFLGQSQRFLAFTSRLRPHHEPLLLHSTLLRLPRVAKTTVFPVFVPTTGQTTLRLSSSTRKVIGWKLYASQKLSFLHGEA